MSLTIAKLCPVAPAAVAAPSSAAAAAASSAASVESKATASEQKQEQQQQQSFEMNVGPICYELITACQSYILAMVESLRSPSSSEEHKQQKKPVVQNWVAQLKALCHCEEACLLSKLEIACGCSGLLKFVASEYSARRFLEYVPPHDNSPEPEVEIAYHGTQSHNVCSIMDYGLVVPGQTAGTSVRFFVLICCFGFFSLSFCLFACFLAQIVAHATGFFENFWFFSSSLINRSQFSLFCILQMWGTLEEVSSFSSPL